MLNSKEFLSGIVFEENPFEDERPDAIQVFDLSGNEVDFDEAK